MRPSVPLGLLVALAACSSGRAGPAPPAAAVPVRVTTVEQAAVENARLQLGFCYIASPLDGRIGRLLVNQGNLIKTNDTELATINQMKPIYVSFTVPEKELPAIRRWNAEHPLVTRVAF